jgi:hypothetical protein
MRLLSVALIMALASPGLAQSPSDSALARLLPTLSPGTRIRVGLLRERWTGRFAGTNGDTLFLAGVGGPPMAIRFNAVDTLWRGSRAWRKGTLIGGIAGALVGAIAVVSARTSVDSETGPAAVLLYTTGGAAGGALYGAAIGSLFRTWRRIHP